MRRSRWGGWFRGGVVVLGVAVAGSLALAPGAVAAPSVGGATTTAVAAATADGLRVAVAVTDTTTGTTTVAGEAEALLPSESVVKVLVAARLLVDGAMTGAVASEAAAMVTTSDDDAADALWGLVGGPDVVSWATARYGLTGLGEPSEWGWWGNTKVSAAGLTALYTALLTDPVVAPWLVEQLSAMTPTAADGTDQRFGFASASTTGGTALKQGWGGDDDDGSTANLLSTGYLADGHYAVAAIVQDPAGGAPAALVPTIDALAAAAVIDIGAGATGAAGASATATATATDETMAKATASTSSGRLGGASGPVADAAWWPAPVAVLGLAALVAAATAVLSVGSRRRATARRS